MTEPPGLPPEQDAVRRLLAEARHDGATPPEVVARLDETLASLRSGMGTGRRDTAAEPTVVAPVDLGARRRRLAGVGLLAAAAVVVAGVAIGQALPRMQGSSDAGSAAGGDGATSSQRDFGAESSEAEDDAGADSSGAGPEALKSSAPSTLASLPSISVADPALADQLLALRRDASSRTTGQPSTPDVHGSCLMRGIGPGRRLLVAVDGQPGTVVYQPPSGDAQDVAVFVCGGGEPVRTLTLPAP